MKIHIERMRKLIQYTEEASSTEPYGSSIYNHKGQCLISMVGNKRSPINHAEVLAINAIAEKVDPHEWQTMTLYSTGEPCIMCTSACCWANLGTIIYATGISLMMKLWNIESPVSASDVIKMHPMQPTLIPNICEKESDQLFIKRKDLFYDACKSHRWVQDK